MRLGRQLAVVGFGVVLWTACGPQEQSHSSGGGGHRHDSAHGGVAVELGDHEYHLDFLLDSAEGVLKAWVMDAHAENFVRVTNGNWVVRIQTESGGRDLEMQATANAATGERVGETSQFEARAEWLKGLSRFTATVPRVELRGKRYENVTFTYSGQ